MFSVLKIAICYTENIFPIHAVKINTLMLKLILKCVRICVCVCVCACVCVCMCVFILFHLLASSGCATSVTYVRSSDQRSFDVSCEY